MEAVVTGSEVGGSGWRCVDEGDERGVESGYRRVVKWMDDGISRWR